MKAKFLILISIVLLLASCKSKKNVQQVDSTSVIEQQTVTKPSEGNSESTFPYAETNLTAKVHAKVVLSDNTVSTGGSLKMRKDEVIQVSLVDPMLGIYEIGRLEITPEHILIIDKVNKNYATVTYDDITRYTNQNVTFSEIQALFWKEAMRTDSNSLAYTLPGKKNIQLNLELSNISHKSDWESKTSVSGKYNQVTAEQLFRALSQQ